MKQFDIPTFYRSPIISKIKEKRKISDKLKKDFTPTIIDLGSVKFMIARHFGFCFGVENAIEIVYHTIAEHKDKRIFLLSEMIHNPHVNEDLLSQGIRFLQDTKGNQLIDWDEISTDDIVLIPAFGTTVELEKILVSKNINTQKYNTTCPFVERVWKRSKKLGQENHTVIVHGKHGHEETRATFSHSKENAPTLIIQNMDEAKLLAEFIRKEKQTEDFFILFKGRYSNDFNPEKDLSHIGVVNQTTILASETQAISNYLQQVISTQYGATHFADTRDTLCYATLDNQRAAEGMLSQVADMAFVIGGYNSSNTTHLVELCETKVPTYFISSEEKIKDGGEVIHYDIHQKKEKISTYLSSNKDITNILITSGASCPDALVENVLLKLMNNFGKADDIEKVLNQVENL